MNILYHTHLYNPKFQIYEAVAQEISFLRKHFPGPVVQIDREGLFYDHLPGWLVKKRIAQLEKDVDLNHIYYPALVNKPYFKYLKKPIVYSVVAPGLGSSSWSSERSHQSEAKQGERGAIGSRRFWKNDEILSIVSRSLLCSGLGTPSRMTMTTRTIVVPDQRDVELLKKYGIENAKAILPGVDLDKFTVSDKILSIAAPSRMTLLMASPPWRKHQFEDKGINILLDLVRDESRTPKIHITFLWRGRLYNKMKGLIKKMTLSEARGHPERAKRLKDPVIKPVDVINKIVDPNQELIKVHGTIAIFPDASTAKAYPHSLIESLAAGKPVIISKNIYMADLIEREKCGVVVEPNLESLKKGVNRFIENYKEYQVRCRQTAEKYFSQKRLLGEYMEVYQGVKY